MRHFSEPALREHFGPLQMHVIELTHSVNYNYFKRTNIKGAYLFRISKLFQHSVNVFQRFILANTLIDQHCYAVYALDCFFEQYFVRMLFRSLFINILTRD